MAYSHSSHAIRLELALRDAWESVTLAGYPCTIPVDAEGDPTNWAYAEAVARHYAQIWLSRSFTGSAKAGNKALYPESPGKDTIEWTYWAAEPCIDALGLGAINEAESEITWALQLMNDDGQFMASEQAEAIGLELVATWS